MVRRIGGGVQERGREMPCLVQRRTDFTLRRIARASANDIEHKMTQIVRSFRPRDFRPAACGRLPASSHYPENEALHLGTHTNDFRSNVPGRSAWKDNHERKI
jgi:hypothetical protein